MNWPPRHYKTNIYINIDIIIQKDKGKQKSAKIKAPAEGYVPFYILTITETYIKNYMEPIIYAKLL